MAKPLPKEDFRSVRIVLEPDDFALGSDAPDPPPRDLVSEETWIDLVELSDDVAIRTSNDFGRILKEVSEFKNELMSVLSVVQAFEKKEADESPICHVLFAAYEDMDASIYNALTGHYRVAFAALRNVVENCTIGLHLELSGDYARFQSWLNGNDELKFGWAADNACQNQAVHDLEANLTSVATDNLFRQKAGNTPAGFARRLFGKLSKFTHGGPGFTDGDMWASNGPVFVSTAFIDWAIAFIQVYAFCLVACRLSQPKLLNPGQLSEKSLEQLFKQATRRLDPKADGAKLFQNLPAGFW